MKNKKFYITTPLYYPSSNLHIGHAYTTIIADIIARYKKENNYKVFFLVGSDEHGQKIQNKAKEVNKNPIEFVDDIVIKFKELWKLLDIQYDKFIRTTNSEHQQLCKTIFTKLLDKQLIYKGSYKGKYCKSCEEFLTSTQIENNICKICNNKPDSFSEETYFFKMSKFKNFLVDLLNSDFLFPSERNKEMLNNFVNKNLEDLSVTRISFDWGIKINEDKNHILYVWLDALLGYLSGIKYQNDPKFFNEFWGRDTEIVQLIGKEITRFHSIYWPSILKSLDLRMPNKLISHGWIIMDDKKMSKSLGNIIDPTLLIDKYGSDAVRYFLSTALKINSDNNYSEELFLQHYNNNLVNNYGNLVSRVSKMIIKYFDGEIKNITVDENDNLIKLIKNTVVNVKKNFDDYNIVEANKYIMELSSNSNKYIEDEKPWTLYNKDNEKLKQILIKLSLSILTCTYLLKPIITTKYKQVFNEFNISENSIIYENLLNFDYLKNIKIKDSNILFKRK